MAKKIVCKVDRVKTGIKGLDKLICGGFIPGQSILVCGMPGTGKTILGLQFLYRGITDNNENGLYVSVEDHPDKLKIYGANFGWDVEGQEKKQRLSFINVPIDNKGYKIVDVIATAAARVNAKRIVIDSLSALNINAKMFDLPLKNQADPTGTISRKRILKVAGFQPFEDIQQFTYLLVNRVADIGATTLFLTDSPPGTEMLTRDGISEFASDGVIQLQLHDTSKNVNRTIAVKKLRGTDITPGMNSIKFTKNGLEVSDFKAFY